MYKLLLSRANSIFEWKRNDMNGLGISNPRMSEEKRKAIKQLERAIFKCQKERVMTILNSNMDLLHEYCVSILAVIAYFH